MAIRIVEGVLGSGKTYFSVHWLVTNCCKELKDGGYVLDPEQRIRVLTNIDGLKLPHESFEDALKEAGGFEKFFTEKYQESFSRGYRLIYILDEAQEWFRTGYVKLLHENLIYFEKSRHHAHDIWLITQEAKKIHPHVAGLCEYIATAEPRSLSIAGEMTYRSHTYSGTELETYRLLFSSKIAGLYKSASQQEAVKIKNPIWRRYMLALAFAALLMLVGLSSFVKKWTHFMGGDGEQKKSAPAAASSVPSSSSTSSGAAPASPATPASAASAAAAALPAADKQIVEYYMYRLDHVFFGGNLRFLLGITWMSPQEFPYTFVKRGNAYFAMIPSVLLPALENNSRALPIRTNTTE